jgi:peptidyl-prolyl cis-trans isomerase SurA
MLKTRSLKVAISILLIPIMLNINLFSIILNTNTVAKKDAKKLAEYYRQRALRGESVASLAKLYSEDTGSAANGGQYSGIKKGMMVPEFEKVAFSLKPGEISEVFETKFGFHFIELISRKNDVLNLRHLLITRD